METAKSKWTLFVTHPTFSWIFFQTNFISLSSYAYLWAVHATDPVFACICKIPHNRSHWWKAAVSLFFMWFQLFEAIGEDRSPLCTESMIPLRSQGCATLPHSAGPGHIWAIFLTHPKGSCSFWTRRTSSLAKLTTFSYGELWESTLEKIPNKISFPRRLERQGEVMALRQLSNPMTARESPSRILTLHWLH